MREEGRYGQELILDLFGCDTKVISSGKKLQEYVIKLCSIIKMKRYGKTRIAHFGYKAAYTKGYSLVQLIETSCISGHFSELWNSAYINIFSCKKFSARQAAAFTKKFFGAKKVKARVIVR